MPSEAEFAAMESFIKILKLLLATLMHVYMDTERRYFSI